VYRPIIESLPNSAICKYNELPAASKTSKASSQDAKDVPFLSVFDIDIFTIDAKVALLEANLLAVGSPGALTPLL